MVTLDYIQWEYKGHDLPFLKIDGEGREADHMWRLWLNIHRLRLERHRGVDRAAAYRTACDAARAFFERHGLPSEEAERFIFCARVNAEVACDEWDEWERRQHR